MKKINNIVSYINKHIDFLLENNLSKKEKRKISSDISQIRQKISDIKSKYLGVYDEDFPYTYCEIKFDGEYILPIPKYGLEETSRTLKGTMYFNIISGDEDEYILDLKTKSLKNTQFKIKIKDFRTFKLFQRQNGDATLVYKNILEGTEVGIVFQFLKLK